MRQRHIKQATIEHLEQMGVLTSPHLLNLPKDQVVHVEVGSGKGQFITSLAKDHPNQYFIAIEMDKNVCYRIAEKKVSLELSNLLILLTSAETMLEWFSHQTIDYLYLNFSDPWPKPRHHKRRLTYPLMLEKYKLLLKKQGIFQFRTDHLAFFEDSLTYLEPHFLLTEVNLNLPVSAYMTEYEVKKRNLGHIYQVKGCKTT